MKRNNMLQKQIKAIRGQAKKVTPEIASRFENMTVNLTCQSLTDEELRQVIQEIESEQLGSVYELFTTRQQVISDYIRECGHPLTDDPGELKKILKEFDLSEIRKTAPKQ